MADFFIALKYMEICERAFALYYCGTRLACHNRCGCLEEFFLLHDASMPSLELAAPFVEAALLYGGADFGHEGLVEGGVVPA